MPTFDLGAVEPLHCKLKPFVDFDENIREPSDPMIGQFMVDLKTAYKNAARLMNASNTMQQAQERVDSGDADELDVMELMAALDQLDGNDYVEMMADVASAYSKLCSGRPSTEQLLELPLRARTGFFNWMMAEVVRPEAESADGQKAKPKLRAVQTG